MKKQIITLSLGLLTINSFSQKKELKAATKLLKKNNFTGALAKIKSIDQLIKNADDKYKAQYYFLKGKTLAGQKNYADASTSLNQLLAFEKKVGKNRYSSKATPILQEMIQEVSNKAIDLYNNKKNYKEAAKNFYLTYQLSPKDTSFVYNAAISSAQAKEYDQSLKYYKELQTLKYTGIETLYLATDKSGKVQNLGTKEYRDSMVKLGQYTTPKTEVTESKQGDIAKSIAGILTDQGKKEEAIEAIAEARKLNPKDTGLILAAANIYNQLKRMDKYEELIKEATALSPNDELLFYNLGVVSANQGKTEEAIKNYKKAIKLKPDYYDANMNMAAVILAKNSAIVDEINRNLDKHKVYNKLVAKQKKVYREALPYLEKADELKREINTVETLKNIYESLGMKAKAKKFLTLYKSMK